MLSSVVEKVGNVWGKDFLVASFLPCIVFLGAVHMTLGLAGIEVITLIESGLAAGSKPSELGLATIGRLLLLLAGTLLLAYFIELLRPWYKGLIEGDWSAPIISHLMTNRHRRRMARQRETKLQLDAVFDKLDKTVKDAAGRLNTAIQAAPVRPDAGPADPTDLAHATLRQQIDRAAGTIASRLATAPRRVVPSDLENVIETVISHSKACAPDCSMGQFLTDRIQELADGAELLAAEAGRSLRLTYPQNVALVVPTAVGNVRQSMHDYCYERYGMDALATWSSLECLLPEASLKRIDEARLKYDFALSMSFVVLLYVVLCTGIIGLGLRAIFGATAAVVLLIAVPLAWSLCAWAAYRAMLGYAAQWRSAYDLHRFALLKAMRFAMPETPEQEKAMWAEASRLVLYANPRRARFVHPHEK